jgi:SM-20-related protein
VNFSINPHLDPASIGRQLGAIQRMRIPSFLASSAARDLENELRHSAGWRHVIKGGDDVFETSAAGLAEMADAERRMLEDAIYRAAREGFQFRYDTIRVPDLDAEREAQGTLLARFAQFMTSRETLQFFRDLTGRHDIDFVDAQATRYRPGDFLTRHDDVVAGKNRTHAYVLSLTRDWRPEWGGLLLFNGDDGGIVETMVPQFNTLHVFEIGQPHSVSFVAPYAGGERISVTGWLRTAAP